MGLEPRRDLIRFRDEKAQEDPLAMYEARWAQESQSGDHCAHLGGKQHA